MNHYFDGESNFSFVHKEARKRPLDIHILKITKRLVAASVIGYLSQQLQIISAEFYCSSLTIAMISGMCIDADYCMSFLIGIHIADFCVWTSNRKLQSNSTRKREAR